MNIKQENMKKIKQFHVNCIKPKKNTMYIFLIFSSAEHPTESIQFEMKVLSISVLYNMRISLFISHILFDLNALR